MKHSTASLVALSLLSLVACKDPNAGVPRARTSAAPAASTTPAAQPDAPPAASEHLNFEAPASTLGFTGAKVTGTHSGSFGAFAGAIDLFANHVEESRIQVSIQMATVTTDTERLTTHLKSGDFFDVARFPAATFASTSIRAGGEGNATHTITGALNLHGQTKTITFPATIAVTPTEVTAQSEFVINRRDFGIVYAGMPDNLIRDEVTLRFNIRAPRTAH
jgi:polyisoprenoid-binding protein YceI